MVQLAVLGCFLYHCRRGDIAKMLVVLPQWLASLHVALVQHDIPPLSDCLQRELAAVGKYVGRERESRGLRLGSIRATRNKRDRQ